MTADRIPLRTVPTFADRLNDARACGHTTDQHRHTDGLEADTRVLVTFELTAERDRARADRDRYARTAANLLHQRNEAANQLELVTAERDRLAAALTDATNLAHTHQTPPDTRIARWRALLAANGQPRVLLDTDPAAIRCALWLAPLIQAR